MPLSAVVRGLRAPRRSIATASLRGGWLAARRLRALPSLWARPASIRFRRSRTPRQSFKSVRGTNGTTRPSRYFPRVSRAVRLAGLVVKPVPKTAQSTAAARAQACPTGAPAERRRPRRPHPRHRLRRRPPAAAAAGRRYRGARHPRRNAGRHRGVHESWRPPQELAVEALPRSEEAAAGAHRERYCRRSRCRSRCAPATMRSTARSTARCTP